MLPSGTYRPPTRGAFPLGDGQFGQPPSVGDGECMVQIVKNLQRHTDQAGGGLRTTGKVFVNDLILTLLRLSCFFQRDFTPIEPACPMTTQI